MFGLFNLMGYRDHGKTTHEIMRETADLVRLADEAGFEMAWFAEHHFSNYCVCPSPLIMAAHCAAITERIKLATGIVILPLYEPARLLAEIGMVDALSNGRLVLGVGSGYQPFEFDRFGSDLSQSKARSEEILDMIEDAFSRPVFEYEGEHYSIPPTHIAARGPQGVPEIWIAGDAPDLQRLAARRGYSVIYSGRHEGADYVTSMRQQIDAVFTEEGVDPRTARMGNLRYACVTDSKEEARAFADNCMFQVRLAVNLRNRHEVMDDKGMMQEIPMADEPDLDQIMDNLIIGDAETCAEKLVNEIKGAHPSHIAMFFHLGNFPIAAAMRSVERFASDVVPMIEKEIGPLDAYDPTQAATDAA
jgi:alkanesulfonate monooxygenase SsuD/methylene tetrahydromethanopterin reductase-like flavin-dependent oxidoreductase (luciferase family)